VHPPWWEDARQKTIAEAWAKADEIKAQQQLTSAKQVQFEGTIEPGEMAMDIKYL
jgi:hypothetical protein